MEQVRAKIRKLRMEKGFTLNDLGLKTGLSAGFLSQVERGVSSLAITSLKKIADALDVPVSSFFEPCHNKSFVIKRKDQSNFKLEGSDVEYTGLAGEFNGRLLEPLIVSLPPGESRSNGFSHPGEEFYYVLQGKVIFNVDNDEYLLNQGDSIHFPSQLPHSWQNPEDVRVDLLCILTPVIF